MYNERLKLNNGSLPNTTEQEIFMLRITLAIDEIKSVISVYNKQKKTATVFDIGIFVTVEEAMYRDNASIDIDSLLSKYIDAHNNRYKTKLQYL